MALGKRFKSNLILHTVFTTVFLTATFCRMYQLKNGNLIYLRRKCMALLSAEERVVIQVKRNLWL